MSGQATLMRADAVLQLRAGWLHTMTPTDLVEAAIWLQDDARYLYQQADIHRDRRSNCVATLVQENAAHSAALARVAIARATEIQP